MLKAVFQLEGKVLEEKIENYFIASRSPLYVGVILPPSKGAWTYMKGGNTIVIEVNNFSSQFRIPYRIEVGENTIFFLKPGDEDAKILRHLEEAVEKGRNVKERS